MPYSPALDPETAEDAARWLFARELPLERSVKVQRLLSTRLTNLGFANVDVSCDGESRFRVVMEEGNAQFDQFYEVGQFIFDIVHESGNRIAQNWIPHFSFDPLLDAQFRLIPPVK